MEEVNSMAHFFFLLAICSNFYDVKASNGKGVVKTFKADDLTMLNLLCQTGTPLRYLCRRPPQFLRH